MRGCSRKTGRADRTLNAFPGDHKAHGFYADGSESNGTTLGFWKVFSNLEGYTGGPLRSDLVVDTNIYNCKRVGHSNSEKIFDVEVSNRRLRFEPPGRGHFEPDVGL